GARQGDRKAGHPRGALQGGRGADARQLRIDRHRPKGNGGQGSSGGLRSARSAKPGGVRHETTRKARELAAAAPASSALLVLPPRGRCGRTSCRGRIRTYL